MREPAHVCELLDGHGNERVPNGENRSNRLGICHAQDSNHDPLDRHRKHAFRSLLGQSVVIYKKQCATTLGWLLLDLGVLIVADQDEHIKSS